MRLYALAAATVDVPVIAVTGDSTVCAEAEKLIPGVMTVHTLSGHGPSVRSIAPSSSVQLIEEAVCRAVASDRPLPLALPDHFKLNVEFRHGAEAYARSFYPGAKLISDTEVELESDDYLAILTFLRFASKYS
nr:M55 family metallopeptidase [Henriciella sp.]